MKTASVRKYSSELDNLYSLYDEFNMAFENAFGDVEISPDDIDLNKLYVVIDDDEIMGILYLRGTDSCDVVPKINKQFGYIEYCIYSEYTLSAYTSFIEVLKQEFSNEGICVCIAIHDPMALPFIESIGFKQYAQDNMNFFCCLEI